MKIRCFILSLLLTAGNVAFAQEAALKAPCSWSLKQTGVAGDPIRISPGVFNVFVKNTSPGANSSPQTGLVVLKVVADEEGKIVDACAIQSPDALLVEPAIRTARTWTMKPYFLNRKPVKIASVVGVRFDKGSIKFEPLQSVPEPREKN